MASFSLPSVSTEPSSGARRWKYDVFLSFRGRDTLNGITVQIRNRLESLGISTFMATLGELQVGDTISPTPMEAIEGSRFAIVVLSPNYAYSTWCLEELVNICNCMANEDRVFPLFHHVDPSEVRYQQRSFGEAFSKHERYRRDQLVKVQEWRYALKYVANMSGWISRDYKTEGELVEDIVKRMCRRIQPIDVKSTIWIEDRQDAPQWLYDVFVSFKAEDISKGFLSELYQELQNTKNIRTFMDDEQLQQGNDISQSRLLAIEESRCAIVLLSPNYASSPRCLEELTKIFSCVGKHGKIVPVFHNVEPSDVRYQKRSFEAAFKIHEERQEEEKVKQWREALTTLANLSGWDSRNYQSSKQIADDIVKYVNHIVRPQNVEFRSAEHKKPADIKTIPIEEYQTTTQVTDQTCNLPVLCYPFSLFPMAPRSQRNYTFLPSAPRWNHEVYLSFSGIDTCKGITSEIYDNLQNIRGVKTFMNDLQFQLGDPTSPRFLNTIEESRYAIVVLSQNYASSIWCLEELAAIVQSMKDGNRLLPIFYKVDASDIRNLEGSFGVAFKTHESSEGLEKVKLWRNALEKVGQLSGWDSRKYGSDKELVEDIVKLVWSKVHQVRFDNESTARLPKDIISEPATRWKYDVFLSFRGEDARENILSHLYRELSDKRGVKTFKDDQKLEKGTPISPNLLMAIEESKFAVVVLSPNYASSTWCLDELIHIFECMEGKNTILPIFYHVDPSHVRKLEHTFKEAFAKHENSGQDKQKMQQWRKALAKVANLSGWDLKNYKDEGELVEDIGKFVWRKVIQLEVDSTMSAGGFEAFTATREAMKQIMKALKNDKVNIFGIYGKGGVGKTTIVKHVGAQAQKDRVFDHVVQISVSRSPDLRNIQGKLAYNLGLNFQDATDIQKAITLKKRFMGGDKILLILDNVWSSIDLSSLGIPSFHELQRCNSKVLIISRDSDACRAMGCQVEINLAILSEVDSLTLFRRQSGKSMESKDVYDAARKVAKQCAGLPIALIAVAKALGDQADLNVWRKAARRLKKNRATNLKDEEDGFNCIKLSYDYLKGEHVKSSFLLCCLFPDNEDIQIADLTEYVYGIGYFKYFKTMQEARAATHLAVIYLKACNLLMDGAEDGCIRMHDVIRDMAISILQKNDHNFFPAAKIIDGLGFSSAGNIDAGHHSLKPEKEKKDDQHFSPAAKIEDGCDISSASKKDAGNHPSRPEKEEDDHLFWIKAGCQLRDWPMDVDKSYSGISVMRNGILKLPEEFMCSKLQILLLQGNADLKDIPDAFIKSLRAMRVLDLSDTTISSLPPSFSLLAKLITLYLDGCQSIIDVSALRGLSSLQILSMRQCRLKELPKEIEELSQLRILDITSDFLSIVPPKLVSRLQSLEELYMQCNYMDWSRNGEGAGNAGFDELTGLSHLYILKVNISDADCLPRIVELSPSWVVFDIRISKETLPKDYFSEPYFKHDHSRTLTLNTPVITLPDWFIMSVTRKADSLQYIDCNDLNNLLVEHDLGILHQLKYLAIIGSHDKLEELMNTKREVPGPNEPVFESIEELHLVGLNCLKELCVGELPAGSLCNLKFLKVEACPNVVNPLLPESFSNLRILIVKGCMKLKSLFTPEVARCLLQLEDLQVADCPQFTRIIEASEETVKKEISFPKLGTLALCSLPKLTWFYCTGNATIKCVSLKQLNVLDCCQFSTSTSDFHTWEEVEVSDLRNLRTNNNEMDDGASVTSDDTVHPAKRRRVSLCQTEFAEYLT